MPAALPFAMEAKSGFGPRKFSSQSLPSFAFCSDAAASYATAASNSVLNLPTHLVFDFVPSRL